MTKIMTLLAPALNAGQTSSSKTDSRVPQTCSALRNRQLRVRTESSTVAAHKSLNRSDRGLGRVQRRGGHHVGKREPSYPKGEAGIPGRAHRTDRLCIARSGMQEYADLQANPVEGCTIVPDENNLLHWTGEGLTDEAAVCCDWLIISRN